MSLEASAAARPFYSPRGFPSRHSRIGSGAGRGAQVFEAELSISQDEEHLSCPPGVIAVALYGAIMRN